MLLPRVETSRILLKPEKMSVYNGTIVFIIACLVFVSGKPRYDCARGFFPVHWYDGRDVLTVEVVARFNNNSDGGEVTYERRLNVGSHELVGNRTVRLDVLGNKCQDGYDAFANFIAGMKLALGEAVSPFPGQNHKGRVDQATMTVNCSKEHGSAMYITAACGGGIMCRETDSQLNCSAVGMNMNSTVELFKNVSQHISDTMIPYLKGGCRRDLNVFETVLLADARYKSPSIYGLQTVRQEIGHGFHDPYNGVKCAFVRYRFGKGALSDTAMCRIYDYTPGTHVSVTVMEVDMEITPIFMLARRYLFGNAEETYANVDVGRRSAQTYCRCEVKGSEPMIVPLPLAVEEYSKDNTLLQLWIYLGLFVALTMVLLGIVVCVLRSGGKRHFPAMIRRDRGVDYDKAPLIEKHPIEKEHLEGEDSSILS